MAYYAPGNLLFLVPDNGDGSQATSMLLDGRDRMVENSQCRVSGEGSWALEEGGVLRLQLTITFRTSFQGNKIVWMAAQGLDGTPASPWTAMEAWRVPKQKGPQRGGRQKGDCARLSERKDWRGGFARSAWAIGPQQDRE